MLRLARAVGLVLGPPRTVGCAARLLVRHWALVAAPPAGVMTTRHTAEPARLPRTACARPILRVRAERLAVFAAAAQTGDVDGLGKAVGPGLGGVGSSTGGLYDSFGTAVSGLVNGAATAALSSGPIILVVGAAIALFAAVFLLRSMR